MKKIYFLLFILITLQLSAQVNLQNGLVAYFPFNGNANDESGNSNHGVVNGASLTNDRFGISNKAYNFIGNSEIVCQSNNLQNNTYTFSVWVKFSSLPLGSNYLNNFGIISIGDANLDQAIQFMYYSSVYSYDAISYYNTSGVISDVYNTIPALGNWYHVVMVRNSTEIKFYYNGTLVSTVSTNGSNPGYGPSPTLTIGSRHGEMPFQGTIDDIRIYNRELNTQEIDSLYHEEVLNLISTIPIVNVQNFCGYSILSTNTPGSLMWSTGDTISSITVTAQGTYSVVSTLNGNTTSPGYGIANPQTHTNQNINITANADSVLYGNSISFTASTNNPVNGFKYKWYVNDTLKASGIEYNNGLVTYYPMNGNANDASGHNYHGTVNAANLSTDRFGNNNSAYSFNGGNSYINIGNWSAGNKWTIDAWINPSSLPGGRHTIAGGMGSCQDWSISLNNGVLCTEIRQPGGCSQTVSSGITATIGTWYHLTGSCDGLIAKVYVNGILMNSAPVETNYTGYAGGSWIGGEVCCSGNYFPGIIDELRIYNRALPDSEIMNLNNITAGSIFTYTPKNNDIVKCILSSDIPNDICNTDTSNSVIVKVGVLPDPAGIISGNDTVCRKQQNIIYTVPEIPHASSYFWTLPNGATQITTTNSVSVNFDSVAVSGNISVKGQNFWGFGIENSKALTVSIPLIIASSNSPLCNGNTLQLNASGAVSYSWTGPFGFTSSIQNQSLSSVNNINAGTYKVAGTNEHGCNSYATTVVSIGLSGRITARGATSFCIGGNVELASTTAPDYTYQWKLNGNNIPFATDSVYTADSTGEYTVQVSNNQGCTAIFGSSLVNDIDGYTTHTFLSSGTLIIPDTLHAKVLIVAGGGGGGMDMGGGGGGGGVIYEPSYLLTPGSTKIIVGKGGKGAPAACSNGQPCGHQYAIPAKSGENSEFGSLIAIGGGFGGSSYGAYAPGWTGGSGGSGGGMSGYWCDGGQYTMGIAGQGYRGGVNGCWYYSGGGGGAEGNGGDGPAQPNGGPGRMVDILGIPYYWGGGGGGAGYSSIGGNGGIGGGGGGAIGVTYGGAGYNNGAPGTNSCTNCQANVPGGDAGTNTGGGGGGGSHYNANNKGGDGGSGIVIVAVPNTISTQVSSSITVFVKPFYAPTPAIAANGPTTFCVGGNVTLDAGDYVNYSWNNGSIAKTINVTTSGIYNVTVTDYNGCIGNGSKTVIVHNNPVAPSITLNGPTAFCNGDSVTLSTPYQVLAEQRFASNIIAYSSQYSSSSWSVNQVIGAPNTYPNYGDISTTWTSATTNGQREFLVLGFPDPAPVNFVDIYETYNPGAIDTVYVKNPVSGNFEVVYSATAVVAPAASRILHISFPLTTFNVSEIRIAMNNPALPSLWHEIDAVSIGNSSNFSNYTYNWAPVGDTTLSIKVKPTYSTNYTLTIKDINGCSNSSSQYITVFPLPLVNISSNGPLSFCPGGSVLLDAGTFNNYQWNTGETTRIITVDSTSVKTVRVTDGNGCVNSATEYVNLVGVTPVVSCPSVADEFTDINHCGAYANFAGNTDVGTLSYSWHSTQVTSPFFFPVGTNHLTMTATNGNCSSSCNFTIIIRDTFPPVISGCPSDMSLLCSQTVNYTNPIVSDNCTSNAIGSQTFNYTGTPQKFVIPENVTSITVKAWGAGGGGGGNDGQAGGAGGAGAYVTSKISVVPYDTLTIYVGSGGTNGLGCYSNYGGGNGGYGYGTGGNGGYAGGWGCSGGGGGGGGGTAILFGNAPLVVAGGGGGAGGGGNDIQAGYGGGGNMNGIATGNGNSSGGIAGASISINGINGDNRGCSNTCDGGAGGGGGGGYHGGGGGSAPFNSDASGAGGGGGTSIGDTILNGTATVPGNNTELAALCPDCAKGGYWQNNSYGNQTSGGNGLVVISYNDVYPVIIQTSGLHPGDVFPSGTTTNTYLAIDVSGNTSTCSFNVTVLDSIQPTISANGSTTFCQGGNVTLDAGIYDTYHWNTGDTTRTIIVNTGGLYSVNVTNTNGCSGSANISVKVNTLPVPVITGGPSFCYSGIIDAGNYSSYIWNTGSINRNLYVMSAGTYTVTVTDSNACSGSASQTVVINTVPGNTGNITGITTVCQGENQVIYTVDTVTHATSYEWILPSGASGTSYTNSITVDYSNLAISGNLTVSAGNMCGYGGSSSLEIAVNALPDSISTIYGPTDICQGQYIATYSIPSIFHADSCIWTLPPGAVGSSITNSITVDLTAATSGMISVHGVNSCGNGLSKSKYITLYPAINSSVSIVSSSNSICQDSLVTFSSVAVNGGNYPEYKWYVNNILALSGSGISNNIFINYPFNGNANDASVNGLNASVIGAILTTDRSGNPNSAYYFNGTNNYMTTNCNISEDSLTVSIWFKTNNANGGIFGVGVGNMGASGNDRHLYLSSGNIYARLYSNEVINTSGYNYADGNWHNLVYTYRRGDKPQQIWVDGLLRAQGSKNYSDFNWQDRIIIGFSNDIGNYFQGSIDDIQIYNRSLSPSEIAGLSAASYFTYFPADNDMVKCVMTSSHPCLLNVNDTSNIINISVHQKPDIAGSISGPTLVTQGQTNAVYSVLPIANATSYIWTLPGGANGVSSTNSISVSFSGTASSGNISVKGVNSCGIGLQSSLPITISPLPGDAASILGLASVCQNQTNVSYTVQAIPNATSYIWTLPPGATAIIINNTIIVDFTNAVSGYITVKGINSFGEGNSSSKYITVNTLSIVPTGISGLTTSCAGNSTTLKVLGGILGNGANWHWYSGSCGGTPVGIDSVITVSPSYNTTYFVRAENVCNFTNCINTNVVVYSPSQAPTAINGNSVYCYDPDNTMTLSLVGGYLGTGANWHWYAGNCGGTPVGTGTSITINPSSTTTYFVRAEGYCNNTNCISFTVNVQTPSVSPTVINGTIAGCSGSSSTLSVFGGNLGQGAQWVWYADSCGGTPLGSGTNINVAAQSGKVYYVRAEGYCNVTNCISRTITEQIYHLPMLNYTSNIGYTNHIVSPFDGTPTNIYRFEVRYTNADGVIPAPTYPRLQLDYEGNGNYTNANDRLFYMMEVDQSDLDVTNGKDYYYIATSLSESQNWHSMISVVDEAGCSAILGPLNEPRILTAADITIFANDISFSNAHPDTSEMITVYATIHNYSGRPADNFIVHLKNQFDTTYVYGDITVPHLGAYSNITVSWNIQTPSLPSWCPMQVFIDWTNVLSEPNELDNQAIRPFTNGNFTLPGKIMITAHPSPYYAASGSSINVCGHANYIGTAVPLLDPSCAGATVTYTVTETGQSGSTYTNSLGDYCVGIYAPYPAGIYHVNLHITDYTLTGDTTTSFEIYVPPIVYCPDLTVSLNIGPQTVSPGSCHYNYCVNIIEGESLSGNVTVYNNGNQSSGPSILHLDAPFGSPAPMSNISIPALSPGASYILSIPSMTYSSAGGTYVSATVDYNNNVAECYEGNNSSSVCIMVHVAQPEITPSGYIYPNNNQCQFNSISFNLDNPGGIATGPFQNRLRIYQGSTLITTLYSSTSNIPALSCTSTDFSWPSPHLAALYTFEFTADYLNAVNEINEANNIVNLSTTLYDCKSDLIVYGCNNLIVDPVDPLNPGNITVSAIIANNGLVAAGNFDVDFNVAGIIHTYHFAGTLGSYQSQTISITVPCPAYGDNLLIVTVDPSNLIDESNNSNNSASGSLCWDFSLSDFCYGGAFWDYTQIKNQPVILNVGVNNSGLYKASNLKVRFEVSGPGLTGWLNLGNATTYCQSTFCGCPFAVYLPAPFAFPQSGIYYVRMTADPDNNYIECNDFNNSITVTVNVTDLPNYRVLSQYIAPSKLNPELDEPIVLDLTYENTGMTSTDSLFLYTKVDNTAFDTVKVGGLMSNTFTTIHLNKTWKSTLRGIHIIRSVIDFGNNISETNEMDNEATRAVIVGKSPDLLFTHFDVNDTLPSYHSTTFMINATIKNVGYDSCNAILRLYYLDDNNNEVFIGQQNFALDTSQSMNFNIPWYVEDTKTTIIGRIVNGTPIEFDFTNNEANRKIGGSVQLSFTNSPASCHYVKDGKAKVIVGGIQPPYFIEWSNGMSTDTITEYSGTYTVNIKDINQNIIASGSVTIGENPPHPVSVSIATNSTNVCINTPVTITAYPVNGGTAPVYQWIKNGQVVGNNSNTYSFTPVNNDTVYSILNSNMNCISTNPAYSNPIVFTVSQYAFLNGDVTGQTNVCQGQNNVIYSIPPITNATSYIWTLPSGASGYSTTNSISINFGPNAISGNISVTGYNVCGYSNMSSLYVTLNPLPNTAGTISGQSTVCQNTNNVVYTVPHITHADSYIWSLPNGVTGQSDSSSIICNFTTVAVSGTISVRGYNSCGQGVASTFNVTVNPFPESAGIISGPANVCQGKSNVIYTLPVINNATSYVWNLPSGASGSSSNRTIKLNFGMNAHSGNISVHGVNVCGIGQMSSRFITIDSVPLAAGSINGPTSVCQGQQAVTYTAPPVANATSYLWNLPPGVTGNSSTNSINLTFGYTAISGDILVRAINECGAGSITSLHVNVNALLEPASDISGLSVVYKGETNVTYSLADISNATSYEWTLPFGASGNSSGPIITVNFDTSAVTGNISVLGHNYCGNSNPSSLTINVMPVDKTTTFLATVSNAWETDANWDKGAPDSSYYAIIADNKLAIINSNGLARAKHLTLRPQSKLTINDNSNLLIEGCFTLLSDANGTASFINKGSLNSISNIIQRYIPVNNSDDFHILGSPIANQAIDNSFHPGEMTFFTWNEAEGKWIDFTNNMFTQLNGNNYFNPGRGYYVSYPATTTKSFRGNINQAIIETNLNVSTGIFAGWNLIANPYPSSINWNTASGFNRNILDDAGNGEFAYWLWNSATGNYGSYISNAASGTNGVSNIISTAQGFWVKANTGGYLSINGLACQHTPQSFVKSTSNEMSTLRIKLYNNIVSYSDELIINFGNIDDKSGAEKLFSPFATAPNIYTTKEGKNWSINKLTNTTDHPDVAMGISCIDGNYTFSVNGVNQFTSVILEDLKNGSLHDLRIKPEYSFSSLQNDNPNRFILHFGKADKINLVVSPNVYFTDHVLHVYNPWKGESQLYIYDVNGQQIVSYTSIEGSHDYPFKPAAGVYFVKLNNNDQIFTQKIIIY
ncbi:MAG: LamG-like jellyroll fold domain-containing protein [Bacteroidales bacterium]